MFINKVLNISDEHVDTGFSRINGTCIISLTNDFVYINYFSLIAFYHSVWLGFEPFRFASRYIVIRYSFTLMRKGYDNHHLS